MIDFNKGSRFYNCRGGYPVGMDDADLRVARKLNLFPSITTLDKSFFKNEGLEKYAKNQLAQAAYAYPRMEHETEETYCNRIYQISLEHSKKAANFGSEVHEAIDHYPQMPLNPDLHPWMERFGVWYDKNIGDTIAAEKVMVDHDLGVAGRCDRVCIHKPTGRRMVPDWKTQGVSKNPKGKKTPGFYDSWVRQLAFYAICDAKEQGVYPQQVPMVMSVVIDSNEPDDPFVKIWDDEEVKLAYEEVSLASYHYFRKRNFWPHLGERPSISFSVKQPYQNE